MKRLKYYFKDSPPQKAGENRTAWVLEYCPLADSEDTWEIVKVKGFMEINLKSLVHCPETRMDTLESSDLAVPVSGETGREFVLWAASQEPPLSRDLEAWPNAGALGAPETIVAHVAPWKVAVRPCLFSKIKRLD